jgi:hypothetical protein
MGEREEVTAGIDHYPPPGETRGVLEEEGGVGEDVRRGRRRRRRRSGGREETSVTLTSNGNERGISSLFPF